jgi:hypothetical protein
MAVQAAVDVCWGDVAPKPECNQDLGHGRVLYWMIITMGSLPATLYRLISKNEQAD